MRHKGYALFIVLVFLTLLLILTTAFSYTLHLESKDSRLVVADAQSLAAADSGLQYALEAIRQKQALDSSQTAASWTLLSKASGESVCFKVFSNGLTDPRHLQVESLGEVVEGDCGDYTGALLQVLSAKTLEGVVDLTPGKAALIQWQEVVLP